MQIKEKNYFRNNFILIFIFILFFISFAKLKAFFNSSSENKNTPEIFLSFINNGIQNSFNLFSNIGGYFYTKKNLLKQINELQNELEIQRYRSVLESSSAQDLTQNISEKDNYILNKDLPVVAKKIFSDFTSIYDTVLLDKGFSSGVEKGDIVFLYPNFIIGQIENVNPNTSLLALYSKDKNKLEGVLKVSKNNTFKIKQDILNAGSSTDTPVLISSSTSISVNINSKQIKENSILVDLYGAGNGDFYTTLPDNLNVSTGTVIYLSNNESKAIGEVVKIEKQEASFYKNILIKGYYNSRLNEDYYIMHK